MVFVYYLYILYIVSDFVFSCITNIADGKSNKLPTAPQLQGIQPSPSHFFQFFLQLPPVSSELALATTNV